MELGYEEAKNRLGWKKQKNTTPAKMTRRISRRIQAQQNSESTTKLQRKHSTSKYLSLPSESTGISQNDSQIEFKQNGVCENDKGQEFADTSAWFFQCGTCCMNFPTSDSLSSHIMTTHNSRKMFQCHLCNIAFLSGDLLSSHLSRDHQDVLKPFKCGLCDEGFFENATLLKHLDENHDELPSFYKCNLCTIPFKEISKLVTHAMQQHPPNDQYRCALCGKLFSQTDKLMNHLVKKHTKETSQLLSSDCISPIVISSKADKQLKSSTNCLPDHIAPKRVVPKPKAKQGLTDIKNGHDNPNTCTFLNTGFEVNVEKTSSSSVNEIENAEIEGTNTGLEEETCCQAENDDKNIHGENSQDESEKRKPPKRKKRVKKEEVGETKYKLIIKDKNMLVAAFMKIDPKTNSPVYDCDVCGQRFLEKSSFFQHRDNHFFDDKFCINCVHCSQVFDTFEKLHAHVGRDGCNGYKCQDCGKSFALEPVFLTHKVREHSDMKQPNGTLTCRICEKAFQSRIAFLRHASSHSEDKCMECKLCRHAFTTQETLFGHLRTTHLLIPSTRQWYKFSCEICGTSFIKNEGLTKHKAIAHSIYENSNASLVNTEKPHQKAKFNKPPVNRKGHWRSEEDDKKRRTCHICHRVFRRFKDARRHIGTHTKPYLCSHCGKSFPYRYSLDTHIKAYHSADNPHKCKTCNKSFSCKRSLLVHLRIHTGEKPHQCPICLKRFRQMANLSMHVKLHNTEKPIKCELCDYRCSHQGYLRRHMATHNTEKKHYCPICNKGFCEKPNLSHHIKRHSQVKNHVCAVCGHRFAERYYLNNHMRVHTKEKPFICPVCNRAFTMRPNMVSHIKKMHPSYNYQPIKRSHQSIANATVVQVSNNNIANDLNIPIESHNFPSSAIAASSGEPSSNSSLPVVSPPTYSLLVSSSQPLPPLPGQVPHLPLPSNNNAIHPYQLSQDQHKMKMESLSSYANPPDFIPQLQPLQRETQLPVINEVINQQLGREHSVMIDQSMRHELERQQNYINITDRFVPTEFEPHRDMSGQSYPSGPLPNQDYTNMYPYPTLPPETSFLHGFFPNLNQQNSPTEPKQ